ncbi:MAG TPA: branched-chain amino acid ABC transporter substrate-binding protein [Oligoflexus sp.]|uniref:branched-chain amino acid ABC transporter substrate-binding protein n=1 Tax=Oligoflexus sp. TaxID=1971216 RepID=UPI002D80A0F5|nr:branched-chain amino acid ABC transporter substrate-binding protein [Oligoflexus sp.]HET9240770.1 branched-chain amino acid ABC transporter substrate-binding protein [Oligoflexus sp.]
MFSVKNRFTLGMTLVAALGLQSHVLRAAGNEIVIGVAGPHTGANAPFGLQLWKGAEAAIKDINDAGGINGKKLRAVKADDACIPAQAKSVANKLVNTEGVTAVVGHFCSSSTIPAASVYRENNVLMITPASTNPRVTEDAAYKEKDCSGVTDAGKKANCELQNYSVIMRMCGRDDQQGVEAAEFVTKVLKAKKVAVIHDKDTYGQGLADAMKAHLKSLGQEPVIYEGLTRGEKDFNALVTKIKAAQADAVYFGGLHAEAGPLLRQMREQGLKAAFISGDGIVSEEFVSSAGGEKFVSGAYMTFGADPRKLPDGKKVVDSFRKTGYEPEGYTLYSYASVQAIAAAIKGTGETRDGRKLSKWLFDNGATTVMGPQNWTKKGDLQKSGYVMYVWDTKGKYAEVGKM